jgi:ABC-type Fe3+/spermidine/putrescine transport system ATPase subunit
MEADMTTETLRTTGLSRAFGPVPVLADINLALAPRDRLAVIGSSGSGKTTLLRLIAGLDVPTAGEITLGGRPASRPARLLLPPERRGVAMVFQGLALFPHLRTLDQVAFAARGPRARGRGRARDLLDRVGLGHRADARPDQLSGGERQRVALARAVAQAPALILMDEPFASLDDERRAEMRGLLKSLLHDTNTALILVTHSPVDALDLAERVLVLDAGRPVVSDSLATVWADPRHVAAARSLALGQIIDGHTTDGVCAQTPFGPVTLARPAAAAGRVRLLIRPAQPRPCPTGAAADVVSVDLRPPDTAAGHARKFVVVRAGGQTLRVEVTGHDAAVGQRITVRIDGPALPLDG